MSDVVEGAVGPVEVRECLREVCAAGPEPDVLDDLDVSGALLAQFDDVTVEVHLRAAVPDPTSTLDPVLPVVERHVVVVLSDRPGHPLLCDLCSRLRSAACSYTAGEIESIRGGMPLLETAVTDDDAFAGWALIFRDHYVENGVGFLDAVERCGLPPEWIFALAKGDRTAHRERVHATFLRRGYGSAILDNSVIDGVATPAAREEARRASLAIDRFIRRAHLDGRRVLVIDDGGLLAQGFGSNGMVREPVDAALELTVSGLKRIEALPEGVDIPVFNMARSTVKTILGYNEIADSCLRRVRALLPGQKFVGRHVVSVGHGTLGRRVARGLRALGCRVSVVDNDVVALIEAGEEGFDTHSTLEDALDHQRPFLIVSSTGEQIVTAATLPRLADATFLAGFATKDFSYLTNGPHSLPVSMLPGVGVRYGLPGGRAVTLLGDGRSLNLFDYEGIPNRGYDAYRAGTLLAAKEMCRRAHELPAGVHTEVVDEVVARSGLYTRYYDHYLAVSSDRNDGSRGTDTAGAGDE